MVAVEITRIEDDDVLQKPTISIIASKYRLSRNNKMSFYYSVFKIFELNLLPNYELDLLIPTFIEKIYNRGN